MQTIRSRGFTLIELLVVIAIIGILSAVVLASLNTARSKGQDAAIKSDLEGMRAQAELYYNGDGDNTYASLCTATTGDAAAFDRAMTAADSANGSGAVTCHEGSDGQSYAVSAQLVNDTATFWCVDSTGNSKEASADLASGVSSC